MRWALTIALAACATASVAAPPPPQSPAQIQASRDFFNAMPKTFPSNDLEGLRTLVSEDLVVLFEGEKSEMTRGEWIGWLNGLAADMNAEELRVQRVEFFIQKGDRVLVREVWNPYKKNTVFHPWYPHKLVSYTINDGKLTRVDYLAEFRPANPTLGAQADD